MNAIHDDIRIGTLVPMNNEKTAEIIKTLLPYGFESFQLNFWQETGDQDIKLIAEQVKEALGDSGAVISSLGMFGNPLGDEPIDERTREGWEACLDHVHLFGADIVAGFAGGVVGKAVPESMPKFKEVFGPLAKRAADKGLRIAFENCTMGSTWKDVKMNMAFNPDCWELMFDALPDANLGLEWEPCHQMCQLIDPAPHIREWADRIFHIHGKDATIRHDYIRKHGFIAAENGVWHRTPGFGDSNWSDIITELRLIGFQGSIDIEGFHDPVYKGELEVVGQVHGLNYLKDCRGGQWVPSPYENK